MTNTPCFEVSGTGFSDIFSRTFNLFFYVTAGTFDIIIAERWYVGNTGYHNYVTSMTGNLVSLQEHSNISSMHSLGTIKALGTGDSPTLNWLHIHSIQ